jgi:hypothetical protein
MAAENLNWCKGEKNARAVHSYENLKHYSALGLSYKPTWPYTDAHPISARLLPFQLPSEAIRVVWPLPLENSSNHYCSWSKLSLRLSYLFCVGECLPRRPRLQDYNVSALCQPLEFANNLEAIEATHAHRLLSQQEKPDRRCKSLLPLIDHHTRASTHADRLGRLFPM